MTGTTTTMLAADEVARGLLRQLGLRQTVGRLAVTRIFIERPGLPASALITELSDLGVAVNRRTVYRTLDEIFSPAGCLARWAVCGPRWVCWGCGRAWSDVPDASIVSGLVNGGVLPLDLGGYCGRCQAMLADGNSFLADDAHLGRRPGRGASPFANRRATTIPIGALYQNPALLRELLGSSRRIASRDFVVANLAENPRAGPTAIHRLLQVELPLVPTLRSVKRVSGALHGPKAMILFASLGVVGWSCSGCTGYGQVPDVAKVQGATPEGFVLTDVRGLCGACRAAIA